MNESVRVRIGIAGVSGYGGRELLRLCLAHPCFEVVYVAGDSTAGQRLDQLVPGLAGHPAGSLVVEPFVPEALDGIDLLFASLPTGRSAEPLARVPAGTRIVDIGGDHRFVAGWTFGVTELPGARAQIRQATRLANPGCYAVASILALAPLVAHRVIDPEGVVIDAKSGVSGAGRGGSSQYGYAETNEDLFAYGLAGHPHVPEICEALSRLGGGERVSVAFTPHLIPMNRGIIVTCYARPRTEVTTAGLMALAREFYAGEPFIRVVEVDSGRSPHTKWATGTNLAFLSYAVNGMTGHVIAIGAIDNLGKGAAGQAVQNANLMTGQPETAGLTGAPLWP